MIARQVPIYRNVTRRLLEPLGLDAGEEEAEDGIDALLPGEPEPPPTQEPSDSRRFEAQAGRGLWVLCQGSQRVLDGFWILLALKAGVGSDEVHFTQLEPG